jgi:hypothetical protein
MQRHAMKSAGILVWAVLMSLVLLAVLTGLLASVEGISAPETITINYIQKKYGPVLFDHSMHTTVSEGCGKCHHMHNDKANATCRECHSLNPAQFKASAKQGFLPCSGCHTDFSPKTPGVPSLKVALHKKCFECHVGIGDLGSSPSGCVKTCHLRQ